MGGASVLIAGVWAGWVQEKMGQQLNELHATSGTLSDPAPAKPWDDYRPGDWVAMRQLRDGSWHPKIGMLLRRLESTGKYQRFRVAVLPSGDLVGREATDLTFLDQQRMAKAVELDPKLRLWRAAMAVKDRAQPRHPTVSCPVSRRRLGQTEGDSSIYDWTPKIVREITRVPP